MKVALVTGSTGLIATNLIPHLKQGGWQIVRAVRKRSSLATDEVHWDLERGIDFSGKVSALDAVIHLAGANVAGKRWSEGYKREIRDSRILGTRSVVNSLVRNNLRPKVFLSASAIGYYGNRGEEILTESSARGDGFLCETCDAWEHEMLRAKEISERAICARFGVVLSTEGGALAKMLTPFKLGLGGRVGTGEQWFSWISLHDTVRALLLLLENSRAEGVFNLVAPNPVRNSEFTSALARAVNRPAFFPVPEVAVSLLFGEMGRALLLASTKVLPSRLLELGFNFEDQDIETSLKRIVKN